MPQKSKSKAKAGPSKPKTPKSAKSDVYCAPQQTEIKCNSWGIPSLDTHGFGSALPMTVSTLYAKSSTGSVTVKNELGLVVTDFFNYGVVDPGGSPVAQPVSNYFWELNQNLFENGGTFPADLGGDTFCRVRSLKVWILPRSGIASFVQGGPPSQPTNAAAMFTVNCQTPGVAILPTTNVPSVSDRAFALNTQVTNVLPQVDTKWKCVFACNMQKTFQSGVARPYIQPFGANRTSQAQCLFQMTVVNPATGKPFLTTEDYSLRVKVQIVIDQPMATLQQAKLSVFRNEEFTSPALEQNGIPYSPPPLSYAQINLRSVMDHLS